MKSYQSKSNSGPAMGMDESIAIKEIKELKMDDSREYESIPPQFIWSNDIRHDRTDFFDH